ncbi:MAG: CDP-6-deoxy-delta-3,4-glucoseen reductase [Gammaproteobacteria bacterium]|nr:MAG: CDP-6-deoxy-delta-3,4-glucoseen reductase [Gammaproteobacteria bacterium]
MNENANLSLLENCMTFQVEIKPSAHRFPVESGETVLEAALHHGIGLPYGCRNGTCGSCVAALESGRIHYPDGEPEALAGEDATGKVIICQAHPQSDLVISVREIQAEKDISIKTLPCRAEQLERLSHDVMLVRLKLPETERMQFLAGQYIEFILKDGRRRAFSIANAPHHDEYLEMHIRHVHGGSFTGHVFEEMRDRALLRIEGPLGSFFLREESQRPLLLMAGGTGFAPLKGMLEHAFYIGLDRPMHLFWGVRAMRDLYMDEIPREWEKQFPNFTYTPVLSEFEQGGQWQGATGPVHEILMKRYPDLGDFDIYMSGPPVMIETATPAFVTHGAHLDHMYSDAFEFAKDILDKIRQSG